MKLKPGWDVLKGTDPVRLTTTFMSERAKKRMMRWKWITLLVVGSILSTASANAGSKGTLGAISDGLAIGVPASAFVLSLYNENIEDAAHYALTLAAQELFVEGAKEVMAESSLGQRPSDRGEERSKGFISSHVSSTTAGAIKLWEMYPDNLFVKGFSVLSVGLVGYQRVSDDHHTTFQVCLGAGTAFLFDWISDRVTERLKNTTTDGLRPEREKPDTLDFSMRLTPDGTGAMGVVTYRF